MSVLYKIATSEICEIETSKIQENMQEFLNWREEMCVIFPTWLFRKMSTIYNFAKCRAEAVQLNSFYMHPSNKKMLTVLYI